MPKNPSTGGKLHSFQIDPATTARLAFLDEFYKTVLGVKKVTATALIRRAILELCRFADDLTLTQRVLCRDAALNIEKRAIVDAIKGYPYADWKGPMPPLHPERPFPTLNELESRRYKSVPQLPEQLDEPSETLLEDQ
jgi:hypothetical protein